MGGAHPRLFTSTHSSNRSVFHYFVSYFCPDVFISLSLLPLIPTFFFFDLKYRRNLGFQAQNGIKNSQKRSKQTCYSYDLTHHRSLSPSPSPPPPPPSSFSCFLSSFISLSPFPLPLFMLPPLLPSLRLCLTSHLICLLLLLPPHFPLISPSLPSVIVAIFCHSWHSSDGCPLCLPLSPSLPLPHPLLLVAV